MDIEIEKVVNKRTGLGAGIGAIVGFFFGGGPVGATVGALVGGALAGAAPKSTKGVMTPKRKLLFESAMSTAKTADYLRGLAEAFENEGFKAEAIMLRKRATLREMPANLRDARREVFRKMMACDDPEEIDKCAEVFAGEAQTDAAKSLRDHAEAVRAAHEAGKSSTPLPDEKMLGTFAEKLGKAIMHFGPESEEAKSAAGNFVQARGMSPSEASIAEVIAAAMAELSDEVSSGQAQEASAQAQESERPSGTLPSAPSEEAASTDSEIPITEDAPEAAS